MNDIDNLLEKYFNGTSSTEEEKKLKNYFEGSGVLPDHEIYKSLFVVFNREKQTKAPGIIFPQKKTKKAAVTRRIIALLAGSAAVAILAVTIFHLHHTDPQQSDYVVITNGKKISNQREAQQYAENMFWETEKIVESFYQPLREATDIRKDLNADKILRETDQKIASIKTNYKQ